MASKGLVLFFCLVLAASLLVTPMASRELAETAKEETKEAAAVKPDGYGTQYYDRGGRPDGLGRLPNFPGRLRPPFGRGRGPGGCNICCKDGRWWCCTTAEEAALVNARCKLQN